MPSATHAHSSARGVSRMACMGREEDSHARADPMPRMRSALHLEEATASADQGAGRGDALPRRGNTMIALSNYPPGVTDADVDPMPCRCDDECRCDEQPC